MTIHRQNFINSNSNSYTNIASLDSTPLNSNQTSLDTRNPSSSSINSLFTNNNSNTNHNTPIINNNANFLINRLNSTSSINSINTIPTPNFAPLNLLNSEIGDDLLNDFELKNDELNNQFIIEDHLNFLNNETTLIEDHFERNIKANNNDLPMNINPPKLSKTISRKADKWFICLVGLPASGKSTIVKQLKNYITQMTNGRLRVEIFNAGDIRREYENSNSITDFESKELRDFYCFEALNNLTNSLINDTCDIGILDATNSTRLRRFNIINKINNVKEILIKPLIFEVKVLNKSLRRFNIENKKNLKDYEKFQDNSEKIIDFLKRIKKYELQYESITLNELSSLKIKYFSITNVGESICFDCGKDHHNSNSSETLTNCSIFNDLTLELIYKFLISYRLSYGLNYLSKVEAFYLNGEYKPVNFINHTSAAAASLTTSTSISISSTSAASATMPGSKKQELTMHKIDDLLGIDEGITINIQKN